MTDATCKNCRWWNEQTRTSSNRAYCQRYPAFVYRKPEDWCGEYFSRTLSPANTVTLPVVRSESILECPLPIFFNGMNGMLTRLPTLMEKTFTKDPPHFPWPKYPTVRDLSQLYEHELLGVPGVGDQTLTQVRDLLNDNGLFFARYKWAPKATTHDTPPVRPEGVK